MVEKVLHLLNLLNALNSHPFLKGKWVLKGGTALNLFVFDLPRLSVDIDLNYIGALGRKEMMTDRPKTEQATQAVFSKSKTFLFSICTNWPPASSLHCWRAGKRGICSTVAGFSTWAILNATGSA